MQRIDYIDAQAQLAKTMRRVCESEQPIAIDGAGKDSVVMMPMEVFQQLSIELGIGLTSAENSCGSFKLVCNKVSTKQTG